MTAKEPIEEKLENLGRAIGSDDSLLENVMSRIDAEATESHRTENLKNKLIFGRFIMNRFTKLTAAAVIIIAVVLSVTILDKSVTPAYAIEQTVEAFKNVRFMHIIRRDETGQVEDERWIEIGPDGLQARYRQDTPPRDFFVVDDRNTVLVHYKDKNTVVLYDPNDQSWTWHYAPRKLFEELADDQLTVTIEENVDYWGRLAHHVRLGELNMDFYIDPQTKLPMAGEGYQMSYEYPPEGTFDIVIPDGVMVVDKRPGAEPTQEPLWMIEGEKDDPIAQSNFDEARRALAKGEHFKAVELFTHVVEIQPGRNWAWFWLGKAHYGLGEYNLAIWEFSKVLDMMGDQPYCLLARGLTYAEKDMQDAAREDLEKALPVMLYALRNIEVAGLFDLAHDPLRCADGLLARCHESPSKGQSLAMMINRLRIITGQNFGYNPDAGAEENEQAIAAWESWFENSGEIRFTPNAELVPVPGASGQAEK